MKKRPRETWYSIVLRRRFEGPLKFEGLKLTLTLGIRFLQMPDGRWGAMGLGERLYVSKRKYPMGASPTQFKYEPARRPKPQEAIWLERAFRHQMGLETGIVTAQIRDYASGQDLYEIDQACPVKEATWMPQEGIWVKYINPIA